MTTINEYRASLIDLSDDDLANLNIATVQERHMRGKTNIKNADGSPYLYAEEGYANNWEKIQLNRDTLANMNRNLDGSPKQKL